MRFLSNKEKKLLLKKLPFGYEFIMKDEIKEDGYIILKNKKKFLIKKENLYLPHLNSVAEVHDKYNSVYVDKGAIPFIIKGADLMRPGIQKIDSDIKKNDVILIKDEIHNKILALGFSLFSSKDLGIQIKGKSVKIYHYVGDECY